jgi:hypothetical protein
VNNQAEIGNNEDHDDNSSHSENPPLVKHERDEDTVDPVPLFVENGPYELVAEDAALAIDEEVAEDCF